MGTDIKPLRINFFDRLSDWTNKPKATLALYGKLA